MLQREKGALGTPSKALVIKEKVFPGLVPAFNLLMTFKKKGREIWLTEALSVCLFGKFSKIVKA